MWMGRMGRVGKAMPRLTSVPCCAPCAVLCWPCALQSPLCRNGPQRKRHASRHKMQNRRAWQQWLPERGVQQPSQQRRQQRQPKQRSEPTKCAQRMFMGVAHVHGCSGAAHVHGCPRVFTSLLLAQHLESPSLCSSLCPSLCSSLHQAEAAAKVEAEQVAAEAQKCLAIQQVPGMPGQMRRARGGKGRGGEGGTKGTSG